MQKVTQKLFFSFQVMLNFNVACLFVYLQNHSKTTARIVMKFLGGIDTATN